MPEQDQDAKRKPGKPAIANDNRDENAGQRESEPGDRGHAVTSGGNKIHGDELEGIIPGKPSLPHTDRHPK